MVRASRSRRFLVILTALFLVAAACGDDDDGDSASGDSGDATTVAFAFVGPLTGPNAALGVNIRNAAQVALNEANESQTDYHFELREFDTQGDPAQATTAKDKFIEDEEVLGVIGPTFSGETKAVLPDLQEANLVMVSASATNVDLPNVVPDQTVFHRLVPDDDVQGQGLSDYATKVLKAKTVVYINDNTDYGKGLADGTQALLEAAGVETVATDVIDPKAESYAAAVTKAKAANADMIFYGGYYAEAGRLKKQLTDEGVTATFVSGDGSLDLGFIASAGAAGAEGAQLTCPCRLATEDAEGALGEFATAYKALNNADAATYSTQGYDAANLLVTGVLDGNDTREDLLAYVEGLSSFDGVAGTVEFEDNGNSASGDVYVYEVQGGKLVEKGTVADLAG